MKKATKLVVFMSLLAVGLATFYVDSRRSSFAGQQQRPQTAHLICCNLLVSVPGTWIGASRDCDDYMRNASADVRANVCRQLGQSGLVCAETAAYCSPPNQTQKCDTKAACEIVRAMLGLIAGYESRTGFDPGSFARFVNEFNPQLQKLSEALACRFNEGTDAPPDAAQLKDLLGQLLRDRNSFRTLNRRSEFPQPSACIDRTDGVPIRASLVNRCADYDTVQRIKQNLARLAGVLGCPVTTGDGQGNSNVPCKQLSNGLLDGLTTFFDQMDELQAKNQLGSGESYDQVAGGIESALDELQDAAKEIEGTGGTGAQQYKDIQGKIAKLRRLLDVWNQMKAASCLPPEIEQLLRRLAQEKRAGTEHKATCTELCGATADWYVDISGLAPQRGTFFKACTLACF